MSEFVPIPPGNLDKRNRGNIWSCCEGEDSPRPPPVPPRSPGSRELPPGPSKYCRKLPQYLGRRGPLYEPRCANGGSLPLRVLPRLRRCRPQSAIVSP
jgi:hypothetical protein